MALRRGASLLSPPRHEQDRAFIRGAHVCTASRSERQGAAAESGRPPPRVDDLSAQRPRSRKTLGAENTLYNFSSSSGAHQTANKYT